MARRVPRAHTDASRSGRTGGHTNGVYFCRVAAAVAGQKACGFYPAPLCLSRFHVFSLRPRFASQPPLFSLRAPLFLLPRRFCRAPFSSFSPLLPPLSLSLSLPVATVLSSSLLFSSFSHFAKLAAVLPRLPRSSLSLAPVPTTAEAIEHASDGDARYRRVHLTRIERKKEEKGGSRDGGTETDVFEARKRSELRPSTVESSRVESSRAESSRAEPSRIGSGRVASSCVESSRVSRVKKDGEAAGVAMATPRAKRRKEEEEREAARVKDRGRVGRTRRKNETDIESTARDGRNGLGKKAEAEAPLAARY